MHDMSLTLENISYFWGEDVLNCRNFHSITPMYLANGLLQESARAVFLAKSTKNVYPRRLEERKFILHFWMRFLFRIYGNKNLRCIFRFKLRLPRNMYTILKAFVCFRKVAKVMHEENDAKDHLIFMKASYQLLKARDLCFSGRKRKFGR
jgi:hypothetical protein